MTDYNVQLNELHQKISRKSHFEKLTDELKEQRKELSQKVERLKYEKQNEERDVERLEGRSLAALFYSIVGTKVEKLGKERDEAYAAAVKYDVAVRELEAVDADIEKYEAELRDIRRCESRYENLLKEKKRAICESDLEASQSMRELEEKRSKLENKKLEINEALREAERAACLTGEILQALKKAENWGVWDAFGGGMIADMVKHDALDHAQDLVEELQVQLRRVKTELSDVAIYSDMHVGLDSFTRFADYFFDGIFTDWAVLDRISNSISEVQSVDLKLEKLTQKLNSMKDETERKLAKAEKDIRELTVSADM